MTTHKYEAQFTVSGFDGGWIVPVTERARESLARYYGEQPYALTPLGGVIGYIVEPYEMREISDIFRELHYGAKP